MAEKVKNFPPEAGPPPAEKLKNKKKSPITSRQFLSSGARGSGFSCGAPQPKPKRPTK